MDWDTIQALPSPMGAQDGWGALAQVISLPQIDCAITPSLKQQVGVAV